MRLYGGYIKDENLLRTSASGGLATAAALHMLKNNGVIYGVVYNDDFKSVRYDRIDCVEKVKELQGSKYLKANPGRVLDSVINDL